MISESWLSILLFYAQTAGKFTYIDINCLLLDMEKSENYVYTYCIAVHFWFISLRYPRLSIQDSSSLIDPGLSEVANIGNSVMGLF